MPELDGGRRILPGCGLGVRLERDGARPRGDVLNAPRRRGCADRIAVQGLQAGPLESYLVASMQRQVSGGHEAGERYGERTQASRA